MPTTLQIIGPDGIDLIDGTSLSSLDSLPPGGFALVDAKPNAALSITLSGSLTFSASSAGGATITQSADALTISGNLAEVNAALASLVLGSTVTGTAALMVSATDGTITTTTTLAVDTLADTPPAFIAPPSSLTLAAGTPTTLGLTPADDPAAALAGFGLAPEMLTVTLLAGAGTLLLDAAAHRDVGIAGDGTGTIVLTATSADLTGLNAALGAVLLDAAGPGTLEYVARQSGGPLADTVTSGSLSFTTTGNLAADSASWAGGAGNWQDATSWTGGQVPGLATSVTVGTGALLEGDGVGGTLEFSTGAVAGIAGAFGVGSALLDAGSTVDIGAGALSIGGGLSLATASLVVGAVGALEAGGVTLGAGALLAGFGTVALDGLDVAGAALLPGGGTLGGPIAVAAGGVIDFAGTLQADTAAPTIGLDAISLAAGGTIEGAGLLIAGNFSESEVISGPGTILALGPAPLTIEAGSIGGGIDLAIAPGAALEIGAIAPLYGVFDATPVTVGSNATVEFLPGAGAGQDGSAYASTLGEQGGVLILDNPTDFAGTLAGFGPGDRIALPTLTSLSVFNVTSSGFEVAGLVVGNTTQSEIVTIHTSLAAGVAPAVEIDAAGDQVIGLRVANAALTLDDTAASSASIEAVNGTATPIIGLGLLVPSDGTAGLGLTISATHGQIASGTGAAAATLVLTAANALSLNAELAALEYTAPATGSGDVLNFVGGTGLAGLSAAIGVALAPAGTLDFIGASGADFNAGSSWQGGVPPANGDLAVFGSHAGALLMVTGPGVAGAVSIGGGYDFAGTFDLPGTGAGVLDIGAGGFALFDANAEVTLGGGVLVGDMTGAGTLGVAGTLSAAAAIEVGGASAAGGSQLEITGSVAAGSLALGGVAAGTLDLAGTAGFAAVTIGGAASGVLLAGGSASIGLGTLDLAAGTLGLEGAASASVGPAIMSSGTISLDGTSRLAGTGAFDLIGGTFGIGDLARASFGSAGFTLGTGGTLLLRGTLDAGSLTGIGDASIAGGRLALSGAASLAAGASFAFAGGGLAATSLTLAAGATLAGYGSIGANSGTIGVIPMSIAGALVASGGTLTLGGSLSGGATIDPGAALDLAGPASGGTIGFAGTDELLSLNDVATMQDTVANMAAGDAIDLVGVAPSLVSYAAGTLNVAGAGGFGLAESAGQAALAFGSDGFGGTYVTVGGAMPCFTRGTSLLTPGGYRPVEALRPGDRLVTLGGGERPIVWIGWRTIDFAHDPAAALLRPVVFAPGAFGPNCPRRALAVSPLHAIYSGEVLVPAVLLVNGATVTRDDSGFAVTYYHVELDRHDVVQAENLPAETYRDSGNRDRFLGSLGVPGAPMESCVPVASGGRKLRFARTLLHRRALALGHQIVHGAEVEAEIWAGASARRIEGRCHAGRLIFDLPDPAALITLRSRTGRAADTDPASEDRRSLGICAGALRADGRRVAVWHGAGWHSPAPQDRGLWSTAAAELRLLCPARRLSIDLLGSVPRWVRDPAHIGI